VLILLTGLCGPPHKAWAVVVDPTQGTSCTGPATGPISGSTNGASVVLPGGGNNLVCISGTWQYPYYVLGTAAAAAGSSCSGYPAGALRYNTTLSNAEMCNGTNWEFLAASTSACGTPSGLSFTNVTNATLNTVYNSNTATITFSGCTSGGLSVSVSGATTAQISINGGAWTTTGAISSGQTLQVRLTSSGSISTGLSATVTVGSSSATWTVTTRSGSLNVFLTPNSYGGVFGGLSGADVDCQTAANAAGYSGTYQAILSDDTTNAASRLTLSYPIVNAYDGSTVAATNLWNGNLANPIKNPSGGTSCGTCYASLVWSGSNYFGQTYTGHTCSSWTSSGASGGSANSGVTDTSWLQQATWPCAYNFGLYCIQQ
jgi:hypothetical protein